MTHCPPTSCIIVPGIPECRAGAAINPIWLDGSGLRPPRSLTTIASGQIVGRRFSSNNQGLCLQGYLQSFPHSAGLQKTEQRIQNPLFWRLLSYPLPSLTHLCLSWTLELLLKTLVLRCYLLTLPGGVTRNWKLSLSASAWSRELGAAF